jgi:hypothetical protein
MKVTLTHIGAIALGRLLAIWTFVLGLICLFIYGIISILFALLGMAAGADLTQAIIAVVILIGMGVVGLVVSAIVVFIFGFIMATVYNIILGIGGGIDMDFKERT